MTFDEVLPLLRGGKKVRRRVWAGHLEGTWVDLVTFPQLPDGRQPMPQLMVEYPSGVLRPFAGANWDLLEDDWEVQE